MDVLTEISTLLDTVDDETVGTSMRMPPSLRKAAGLAAEHLGVASSATTLTIDALRNRLEAVVMESALEAHYADHPKARPSLADVAVAAAEMFGHPLASPPQTIRRAAKEIVKVRPDADAHDVLVWADAIAAARR